MKKIFTLLSIIISFTPLLKGQENSAIPINVPVVTPVSPEAASVQRYVDYPVDYSTGIPEINIPLYEIQVGDIYLPISLSYHSAGLQPKEFSGIVGTGWTLNADPSVTRSVQGLPDEINTPSYKGFFHTSELPYNRPNDKLKEEIRKILRRERDMEPDRFFYKLPTQSGGFYPLKNGSFMTHPHHNIKIEEGTPYLLNEFAISDEKGITYTFGGSNANCHEKTGDRTESYTTRWLCSSAVSVQTGAKIFFEHDYSYQYMPEPSISDQVVIESFPDYLKTAKLGSSIDGILDREETIIENGELEFSSASIISGVSVPSPYSGTTVFGRLLTKITFDGGTLTFSYKTKSGKEGYPYPMLTKMMVKDKSGNLIRTIHFYISEYNTQTRLTKLDSICISAPDCEKRWYDFSYNGTGNVPNQLTKSLDHWGFYNNNADIPSNQPFVPSFTANIVSLKKEVSFNYQGVNKNSSATCAQYGMLRQIQSPEKVLTEFNYESNRTAKKNGSPYDIGGLRISSIVSKDLRTQRKCRRSYQYEYRTSEGVITGVGAVPHHITDSDYQYSHRRIVYPVDPNSPGGNPSQAQTSTLRIWASSPLSKTTFNSGSAVLYQTVTETQYNEIEANSYENIKNVYHYKVPELTDKTRDKNLERPYDEDNYSDYRWGQLIEKETYVTNPSGITRLKTRTENSYTPMPITNPIIKTIKPYHKILLSTVTASYNTDANSKESYGGDSGWAIEQGWMRLDNVKQTEYFENGSSLTTTQAFTYLNQIKKHQRPIIIETTGSNSKTIKDYYYYSGQPEVAHLDPQELLSNRGIVELLEHRHWEGADIIYTQQNYAKFGDVPYTLKPQTVKTKIGSGDFRTEVQYLRYDKYGNIAEVADKTGLHTCYIWSYNYQYPVAKLEGMTYDQLLRQLNDTNEEWIKTLGNKIAPSADDFDKLNGLRNNTSAHVTTYTYSPLIGVTSITEPNNLTTYFKYDSYARLTESYILKDNVKQILAKNIYALDFGEDRKPESNSGSGSNIEPMDQGQSYIEHSGCIGVLEPLMTRFDAVVCGGSSTKRYRWKLTDNQGNILKETETRTPYVAISPIYPSVQIKLNILHCNIFDWMTGQGINISIKFHVLEKARKPGDPNYDAECDRGWPIVD